MRIAVLVHVFPALSETFILNQITGLLNKGHEVVIFAEKKSDETKVHPDVLKYRLLERTFFLPHMPSQKSLCLMKALGLWLAAFVRFPAPMLRFLRLFVCRRRGLSLGVLYYLLELCRHPVDVLFCQYGPNGSIGVLLKEALARFKLVTMFHGYDIRGGAEKWGRTYQPLFDQGDLFLANSRFTRQILVGMGADAEKIQIHPVGVDLEIFRRPCGKSPRKEGQIVLLSVGRLVEEKGYEYALRAIQILKERTPNILYRIIGGGPLENDLKKLTLSLSLFETVQFWGPASQEEVLQNLQEADIFVLSSVSEALGLSLIEAQALGLPVVATRVGGVPEAVLDGRTGFLVPERDSRALAEKIQFLIEHPEVCREMGQRGREYVRENYDIHQLNYQLEKFFSELLTKPGCAGRKSDES